MFLKYGAFALVVVWCQIGCEFRDESKFTVASETRTDLTFAWGDSVGSHEILRSFEVGEAGLSKSQPLPVASIPESLSIQGFEPGPNGCVARLWVRAEIAVKLECVAIEGSKEITVRGLNLAIPPNVDGLHPLRVEVGSSSINFGLRSLPSVVPLNRVERTVATQSVGTSTNYHQVAAFEIARSAAADLTISIPTKVSAVLKRKRIHHTYNFDFMRCEFGPITIREDIDIAVEVMLVPDDSGLAKDWPQFFSLDSQLVLVPKEHSARILAYVADPFLDKVYGPGDFREHSFMATVTELCNDLTGGSRPIPSKPVASRGITEVDFSVREGWEESDPILLFNLAGVQVFDAKSFEIDKKPVASLIAPQSFELVLSRDVP